MKYKELELRTLIDEQPLEEYQVTEEGNVVTCWIASEAGKVRGNYMSYRYITPAAHAEVFGSFATGVCNSKIELRKRSSFQLPYPDRRTRYGSRNRQTGEGGHSIWCRRLCRLYKAV